MATSETFQRLQVLADEATSVKFQDECERRNAVQLAYKLLSKIETPWETISRMLMIDPFAIAALKTLINLQLFEKWQPAESAKSLDELAQMTGCDSRLLCT